MLDPAQHWTFPDLPDVLVYGDDTMANGFYAVPAKPMVASDADGARQINLTLYGHGRGPDFTPTGGLLTVTVELVLPATQRPALAVALAHLLAQRARDKPDAPLRNPPDDPPHPQMLAVDWLDGEVELRVLPNLILRGTPSLSGANRTSFNVKINAAQAKSLRHAWHVGLPDARVRYTARLRGSPTCARSNFALGATAHRQRRDDTVRETSSLHVSASFAAAAVPIAIEAEGPLVAGGAADLAGRLSQVAF